jgi:hypothetical protein
LPLFLEDGPDRDYGNDAADHLQAILNEQHDNVSVECLVRRHKSGNQLLKEEGLEADREATHDAIEDANNFLVVSQHINLCHVDWTQDANLVEQGVDEYTLHKIEVEVWRVAVTS